MRSMRGFVACGAMACMGLSTLGDGQLSKLAGQLAADETTHFTVLNQALGRPLLPVLGSGA